MSLFFLLIGLFAGTSSKPTELSEYAIEVTGITATIRYSL
jgi:hypothetical protein